MAASCSFSFPFACSHVSAVSCKQTLADRRGAVLTARRFSSLQASSNPDADRKAKTKPISFGDRLLDYIEGGPKLRKWYGAPEKVKKGVQQDYEETNTSEQILEDTDGVRDAVLVTDADDETGQIIVLSLILQRARIRVLVKDAKSAISAFGPYVEPVIGDVADKASMIKALRGVRAIICPTKIGALTLDELLQGVEHIVFLSPLAVLRSEKGLCSVVVAKAREQAEKDELILSKSGVPSTVIRTGRLRDEPGGRQGFVFGQGGTLCGTLSREDAATVCIKALDSPPQQLLIFEVVNGNDNISNWKDVFSSFEEGVRL